VDSSHVTREQAEQMHKAIWPLANYLSRLTKRMERGGFPPNDPLNVKAKTAYDATCSLMTELHYLSCKSGVYRGTQD
jgi:hypothetical protein